MTMEFKVNTVNYLQSINFSQLPLSEQIEIKTRGRHTPALSICQSSTSRYKEYIRHFNMSVYQKCEWICGCEEKNSLFCFPCLLFGDDDSPWTKNGVADLRHLPQKIVKHDQSPKHINNMIDLLLLGKVNDATRGDTDCKFSIANHNEQVKKNRDVLSKIINCVKFCGKYEFPLKRHDETIGLAEFVCQMDPSLQLNNAPLFKEKTRSSLLNELLDSMLEICKDNIREEIENAEYLAIICDEITDIYDKTWIVIVLRYELQGEPVERFWGFFNSISQTSEAIARVLCEELQVLLKDCPQKLIAQSYDGAIPLSGSKGVQTRIKEVYCNAHFIHCYAQQLNVIFEKATSQDIHVRVFFNSLSGIPEFFSSSPQKLIVLENVAAHHTLKPSPTSWNFRERTVNAVNEMKDVLVECCSILETSKSRDTGSAAAGIKRILSDPDFEFWLNFFSKVMPLVDILSSQLQTKYVDAAKASASLKDFITNIEKLRDEFDLETASPEQKRKLNADRLFVAKDVCDVILLQCRERFKFTNHLEANKLLLVSNFPIYAKTFPSKALAQTTEAYPMLNKDKLKTELTVLYRRNDLCNSEKLIEMLNMIKDNNLESTFSETLKLLKILITTPLTTKEDKRCFSILNKVKAFLRNTTTNGRLSSLGMLTIENIMIAKIKDFNEHVINHFAMSNSRRHDFTLK